MSSGEADRRRENARKLRAQIADQPALREIASSAAGSSAGYLRFPVLAAQGLRGFASAIGGEDAVRRLGVAASYPKELGELPALARLVVGESRMPGAAQLVHQLVTLPVHSLGSSRDLGRLVESIVSYGGRPA